MTSPTSILTLVSLDLTSLLHQVRFLSVSLWAQVQEQGLWDGVETKLSCMESDGPGLPHLWP
jgi:hypothetical protein